MASLCQKPATLGRGGIWSSMLARKNRHSRFTSFLSGTLVSLSMGLLSQSALAQGGPSAGAQIVTLGDAVEVTGIDFSGTF